MAGWLAGCVWCVAGCLGGCWGPLLGGWGRQPLQAALASALAAGLPRHHAGTPPARGPTSAARNCSGPQGVQMATRRVAQALQQDDVPALVRDPSMCVKTLMRQILQTVKTSQGLPNATDFAFQASLLSSREGLEAVSTHVCALVRRTAAACGINVVDLQPGGDPDDAFESLVEATDEAIEVVGDCMDEIAGVNRHSAAQSGTIEYRDPHARRRRHSAGIAQGGASAQQQADSVREKPQKFFSDKIDNSHAPFVPKYTRPHGAGSTGAAESTAVAKSDRSSPKSSKIAGHAAALGVDTTEDRPAGIEHPFRADILGLERDQSEHQITQLQVQKYRPLDESGEAGWVDTEESLRQMIDKLTDRSIREIAVDLEAHSYRSFQGFVCLMQLSTRAEDWLIDTLALRAHMQLLLPVFTNPKITKVLHGADSDIVWLHRDFGLYIVNLFDTGQAARVLSFPRFGLAYLLKHYCGVEAD